MTSCIFSYININIAVLISKVDSNFLMKISFSTVSFIVMILLSSLNKDNIDISLRLTKLLMYLHESTTDLYVKVIKR